MNGLGRNRLLQRVRRHTNVAVLFRRITEPAGSPSGFPAGSAVHSGITPAGPVARAFIVPQPAPPPPFSAPESPTLPAIEQAVAAAERPVQRMPQQMQPQQVPPSSSPPSQLQPAQLPVAQSPPEPSPPAATPPAPTAPVPRPQPAPSPVQRSTAPPAQPLPSPAGQEQPVTAQPASPAEPAIEVEEEWPDWDRLHHIMRKHDELRASGKTPDRQTSANAPWLRSAVQRQEEPRRPAPSQRRSPQRPAETPPPATPAPRRRAGIVYLSDQEKAANQEAGETSPVQLAQRMVAESPPPESATNAATELAAETTPAEEMPAAAATPPEMESAAVAGAAPHQPAEAAAPPKPAAGTDRPVMRAKTTDPAPSPPGPEQAARPAETPPAVQAKASPADTVQTPPAKAAAPPSEQITANETDSPLSEQPPSEPPPAEPPPAGLPPASVQRFVATSLSTPETEPAIEPPVAPGMTETGVDMSTTDPTPAALVGPGEQPADNVIRESVDSPPLSSPAITPAAGDSVQSTPQPPTGPPDSLPATKLPAVETPAPEHSEEPIAPVTPPVESSPPAGVHREPARETAPAAVQKAVAEAETPPGPAETGAPETPVSARTSPPATSPVPAAPPEIQRQPERTTPVTPSATGELPAMSEPAGRPAGPQKSETAPTGTLPAASVPALETPPEKEAVQRQSETPTAATPPAIVPEESATSVTPAGQYPPEATPPPEMPTKVTPPPVAAPAEPVIQTAKIVPQPAPVEAQVMSPTMETALTAAEIRLQRAIAAAEKPPRPEEAPPAVLEQSPLDIPPVAAPLSGDAPAVQRRETTLPSRPQQVEQPPAGTAVPAPPLPPTPAGLPVAETGASPAQRTTAEEPPAGEPTTPLQPLPLEAVLPVQRSEAVAEGGSEAKKTPVETPEPGDPLLETAPAESEAVQAAIEQISTGQKTGAQIEMVMPRRARPVPPRPTPQPAPPPEPAPPFLPHTTPPPAVQTSRAAERPAAEPHMVQTDIGPLPSDLWQMIGATPPAPEPVSTPAQPPAGAQFQPQLPGPQQPAEVQRQAAPRPEMRPEAALPPPQRLEPQYGESVPDRIQAYSMPEGGPARESRQRPEPQQRVTPPAQNGNGQPASKVAIMRAAAAAEKPADRPAKKSSTPARQEQTTDRPVGDVLPPIIQRRTVASDTMSDIDTSKNQEDNEQGGPDVNVDKLARQVYDEIKRRLAIEWERQRRTF